MNLSSAGWATMTGWTIWMFILPLILEIFPIIPTTILVFEVDIDLF
jgi:hypothetical protein